MDHDDDIDLDNAPLVGKQPSSNPAEDAAAVRRPRKWDFFVLTVPFFGLQLAWTIQQVYGIPYLSSLGVPNTQMPIFVLSGPLAGLIGPPIVAAISEKCNGPWGKRKPFIFLGGVGTIVSFLVLATAKSLAVRLDCSILSSESPSAAETGSHIIAGLSIYALNFSIQPLALGLRSSVVDCFQPQHQPSAMLWVSRFSALGSVFVALVGLVYSPAFWNLSVVVTSVLALLLCVVALTDTARLLPQQCLGRRKEETTVRVSLRDHVCWLVEKARHLPPMTRQTCRVQLVSWFAWFLVLHYTSALTSLVYEKTDTPEEDSSTLPSKSGDAMSRVALLFHSAALVTLVVVSMVWRRSVNRSAFTGRQPDTETDDETTLHHHSIKLAHTRNKLMRWVWRPSLAALAASLTGICLLILMATSPFSPTIATTVSLLLGGNGILFALSNWVPYALIACEASAQAQSQLLTIAGDDIATSETGIMSLQADADEVESDHGNFQDDTPLLLAFHNMAITVPQIVANELI
ncbi:MFS general substrate transporter [Diaporthe amygdali]|uniref:MFS general substrate transporter n=1 Tax=Phomopsis amygdali TaxID=1214568 RepID=UPI0022FE3FA5|nr:MFS general substrate transporter [Diaporthe amygdali]KAJ0121185.1 MFS general substrate transporter [Diaporthe amygdali]